ncbi:MAG TPA: rRNA maturation RNase YbeY [Parcubacteria group bacterium]|jgi:probable rRNA maturation factor|nr:rRNA maturation RNase YbeY [Parcubacteria group bacterium]
MSENFQILNMTKDTLPRVSFAEIKNAILGKKYELSLVFCGNRKSKELNKKYRNKDYTPNVLSFPLDKNSGEIFINPHIAKKEAPNFNKNYTNFVGYLFIHGCLHLKGMEHGSTMDKAEEKFCKEFRIS